MGESRSQLASMLLGPWTASLPCFQNCVPGKQKRTSPSFQVCKADLPFFLCFTSHITCLENSSGSCWSLNPTLVIIGTKPPWSLVPRPFIPTLTIILGRWALITTSLQLGVVGWTGLTWCPVLMIQLWEIPEEDHRTQPFHSPSDGRQVPLTLCTAVVYKVGTILLSTWQS